MNNDSTVDGASYRMAGVHNDSCSDDGTAPDYNRAAALGVKFLWNGEGCENSEGKCNGKQVFQRGYLHFPNLDVAVTLNLVDLQ